VSRSENQYMIGLLHQVAQMIEATEDAEEDEQILPPLSLTLPLENYHTDPLHFSIAGCKALCEHIVAIAIQKDIKDFNDKIKNHNVYQKYLSVKVESKIR
jgi:hypothetical protein